MQKLIEDITRLVHNDVYSDEEKVKITKGLIKEHYLPTTQPKEDDRIDKAVEFCDKKIAFNSSNYAILIYEEIKQYLQTLKQQP